jgi:hypothetical protein
MKTAPTTPEQSTKKLVTEQGDEEGNGGVEVGAQHTTTWMITWRRRQIWI